MEQGEQEQSVPPKIKEQPIYQHSRQQLAQSQAECKQVEWLPQLKKQSDTSNQQNHAYINKVWQAAKELPDVKEQR